MAEEMHFTEDDLASVVQQAMEGLNADEMLGEDGNAHVDEELQREIEQMQQTFHEQQLQQDQPNQDQSNEDQKQQDQIHNQGETNENKEAVDDDDDFAKEVERQLQLQAQFEQDELIHNQFQEPHQEHVDFNDKQLDELNQPHSEAAAAAPEPEQSDDFEDELQKQIMAVFDEQTTEKNEDADVSEPSNEPEPETKQITESEEKDVDYEAQLQELMESFTEVENHQQDNQQVELPSASISQRLAADQKSKDAMTESFNDALAELVQNVVNAQAEVEAESLNQEPTASSSSADTAAATASAPTATDVGDEEEIDMNQIMQNALAMFTEDPNTLLQNFNLGDNDGNAALLNQLLQRTDETTAKGKKKTTKAKEKKPPKQKKPRAPRSTAKKKKEQPQVSQIPIFLQSTPYPTAPFQLDPNFANSQLLNVQPVSKISINQQSIAVPPVLQQQVAQLQQQQQLRQQQALLQQQLILQQQALLQQQQPIPQPQPSLQPTPQSEPSQPIHQNDNLLSSSTSQEESLKDIVKVKQPKPAPANSIIDTVKKTPLILLSKDTSIDLANSIKKKKSSLSIAETLALSRSNMTSGKFSSKLLQEEKRTETDDSSFSNVEQQDPSATSSESSISKNSNDFGFTNSDNSIVSNSALNFLKHNELSRDSNGISPSTSSPSSQLFSVVPGSDGNSILNSIGSMLPELPSNLSDLITNAISNALSVNNNLNSKELIPRQHKRKPLIDKNETPEQQKERIRLENRERKKRWRDANRLKNLNNDLRARLKKKAAKLFGLDDTQKKLDWIELEFERRKNRRIIRSANIEDLSAVISETMRNLDLQTLSQETLARVITQIVTTALNSNAIEKFEATEEESGVPKESMNFFKSNGSGNDLELDESKIHDVELSNLISNSLNEQFPDLMLQPNFETSSSFNQTVSNVQTSSATSEQQFQQDVPEQSQQQLSSDDIPNDSRSNISIGSVPSVEESLIPRKRASDVLSSFDFKKAKISLIPLKPKVIDPELSKESPTTPKTSTPNITTANDLAADIASEAVVKENVDTGRILKEKPINTPVTPSFSTTSSLIKSKPKPLQPPSTPSVLQRPKIPSFHKPSQSSDSKVSPPKQSIPAATSTSTTKINDTASFTSNLSVKDIIKSEVSSSTSLRPVLNRPKFGLRKPPAFSGLRKPGAFQRPVDRDKKKIGV